MKTTEFTRIELIDENGRQYVRYCKPGAIQISEQDNSKTLKIFINKIFSDSTLNKEV